MPLRKRPATTRVPALIRQKVGFQRKEVAAMLGAADYQISRDCQALWPNHSRHALLSKQQARTLYCVAMFRHLLYSQGRHQVLVSEVIEFIGNHPDEHIWAVVSLAGGSKEDCDRGIEEMLIKQNQERLQQETFNVQHTVA